MKKLTLDAFLALAKKIRPEYDYSLVTEYKNNNTKIPVICHKKDFADREHGVFMITPSNLLRGRGCNKCYGNGFTNEDKKLFCSILHKNKYDYSLSDFTKSKKSTTIICPKHGKFEMDYDHHFNSNIGCKYCSYPVRNTESFKNEATIKHKGYYSYNKSKYINSHTKIIITCPVHGDFLQTPNAHLRGEGCPNCTKISILEDKIATLLTENNINFIKGKKAKWLITEKKGQSHLDFFIPEINLAIECQGKQHFGLGGWDNKYNYEERYEIDKWKKEQCDIHKINVVYFANKNDIPEKYLGKIFIDEKELLKYIKYLLLNKIITNNKYK